MADLSSNVLTMINQHHFDTLSFDADITVPYYDGLSLVNIPCSITRLLSIPDFGQGPLHEKILSQLDGPYQKVILLLVDAMGKHLFDTFLNKGDELPWGKHLDKAVFTPITSICPSTTASALTTLWTGEGAGTHGIIGYEMWAKEFGMVMNNINHSAANAKGDAGGLARSGFDPHAFVPSPLLGRHLWENGVRSTAFMHYSIASSGLSVMQMDEVEVQSYVDEADLCVSLSEYINRRQGIREYIYVYYSHVDTLMHRFSAQNSRVDYQFSLFSTLFENAFLNNLSKDTAKDTLLIMTADHGSMTTPKNPRYELRRHPELLEALVMQPTCENRLAFFFIKPGQVKKVKAYIEETWPDEFYLLNPAVALESGLFGNGPIHKNARDRLGDLIAVARGDAYFWWAPKPNHMAGRHGGLSEQEMLVPFYALPLGEI